MKTAIDRRVGVGGFNTLLRLLTCGLAGLGLVARAAAAAEAATGDETFKLREVSIFDSGSDNTFRRARPILCEGKPGAQVRTYPAFASKKPAYGSVAFGEKPGDTNSGVRFYFAVDESRGTGKGYDRLYFDLNRDLDLRDDPVIVPQRPPPKATFSSDFGNTRGAVTFNSFKVSLDSSSNASKPVEIVPRLLVAGDDKEAWTFVCFVRARFFEGDIKVGGKEFTARLGNNSVVNDRLDLPRTTLVLRPKGSADGDAFGWWGADRLVAAHKVKGRFYTFSASPTGDQLTVHPYRGELGTFEIGPGGRTLDKLTVTGSLEGEERAVAVGGEIVDSSPKAERSCQLPAGDYRPNYITIQYGRLRIGASHNYHLDGKPMGWSERAAVYGITIRKDKPFVLDFSNKPEVMFASPAKDQRVKLGESLEVKAVLVDPKLDMMIRRLDDTTPKQTKSADGQASGDQRPVSLDPQVIITRVNGEKVAEGVMPFCNEPPLAVLTGMS